MYTLMVLIGDIGGFQGAIVLIPAFFLSFYTPKMYEASLLSDMPIKKPKQGRRSQNRNDEPPLEERLQHGGQETLQDGDVISLIQEMALIKTVKTGFWETLCHVTMLCGKNRRVMLREKTAERVTNQLDILSIISVDTNLTLLISLLLTRQ